MKGKRLLLICILFMMAMFVDKILYAVEVQLSANPNEEAIKKVDDFFKNNPFPDSAYNVEISKNVSVEGQKLKVPIRLELNQNYFSELAQILQSVSYPEEEVRERDEMIQKRRGTGSFKRYYGVRISKTIYYMQKEIYDYIIQRIGEEASFSIKFPLIIRYEFKDENGSSMQTSDIKYTVACPKDLRAVYDEVTILTDFNWDESQIKIGREEKQSLEFNVAPQKIKEIVASVANLQKKKDEEVARQKQLEERQKQEEAWEAEQKRKEEEGRKRGKARKAELKKLLPKCNNEILSQGDFLVGKNPHADKGKCVEFMAATFQMTSANAGLFNIGNDELAYIEFKKPFRGGGVKGIAKIKGIYTYTARSGTPNQVPRLEMLEIEEIIGQ